MRRVALIVLMSIAAWAADDKVRFAPGPASSYPGHQTLENITIAAVPFLTDEQSATAFGKVNPSKHGVLPVLVVLENGTRKAIRLDLRAEFIEPGNRHVDATPANEVVFLGLPPQRPRMPGTNPLPIPTRKKKGPLNTWEIEGRAFSARLLPAGESVSGFFYFQTQFRPGSKIYLTGLKDAATGKDYFYFEVPIEKPEP